MLLIKDLFWLDWLFLAGLLVFLIDGWHAGFIQLSAGFLGYVAAIFLAVRYGNTFGNWLTDISGIPILWAGIIGYALIALVVQPLVTRGVGYLFRKAGKRFAATRWDNILGSVVSAGNYTVFVAILLFLILAVPMSLSIKSHIHRSVIASFLTDTLQSYGGPVVSSIDELAREAVKFMTVEPASKEVVQLNVMPNRWELATDELSEIAMFNLINAERAGAGKPPLVADVQLRDAARAHSRDMFERRYFSHYTPEGTDVGNRLDTAGILYTKAGENLAYAPDVATAMKGLMASEGHKANILDPGFSRVGIGIIDAGVFGKMFTQVFANQPYYFYNAR